MIKTISIVSPCYNEFDNIEKFYNVLCETINKLQDYKFEILFIDNCSTDGTQDKLRAFAKDDFRVKVIFNARNFGQVRSPYWGLMQSTGEATILMASDLQDPPSLIPLFIEKWNLGWKVILGAKPESETNFLLHSLRKLYYKSLRKLSEFDVIENANGFGLYDKEIVKIIKDIGGPYPYLRGLVCEIGLPYTTINYIQKKRNLGKSKSNFLHLYDVAMLGLINNSTMPLRFTTIVGFAISFISFLSCIFFLAMKIIFWDNYSSEIAGLVSFIFFLFGLLFCFLGILGEYVASIFICVRNKPPVIEKERINFDQ